MPGQRDEKSLGGSRDLQEAGPDLAVGTPRIDEDADDRPLCPQKIDYLCLGLNRRSTTVNPDGKAVPGGRLLQCTRLRSIVANDQRYQVPREVAKRAEAVQLVRVPREAHDRSRSLPEQSDQLHRIRLPLNSRRPPRGIYAARDHEIRHVHQWLQEDAERSRSVRRIREANRSWHRVRKASTLVSGLTACGSAASAAERSELRETAARAC
jgi:hypothetical protein